MTTAPDLRRLVVQHAHTARLLGVDFVPAYRSVLSPVIPIPPESAPPQRSSPLHAAELAPPVAAPAAQPAEPVSTQPQPAAARPARPATPPAPTPVAPTSPRPSPAVVGVSGAGVGSGGGEGSGGSGGASGDLPPPVVVDCSDPERAERLRQLDGVREAYEQDAPHKHFVTAHTHIVFGEGDPCARIMFIGEAPGADEDRTGRPFVGRAGQLLTKMITAMGLRRDQVYITNVLKTRPPNNATPTVDEATRCAPYLFRQVEIIRPGAIVALGLPASRVLLGSDEPMARLRGRWATVGQGVGDGLGLGACIPASVRTIPVMPTYHPAFLLRAYTPENRAKVWSDLQMVLTRLGMPTGGKGA